MRLALLASFTFACIASNPAPQPYAGRPSGYYAPRAPLDPNSNRSVAIVGALIGPGKNNGAEWDFSLGKGDAVAKVADDVATILATIGEPNSALAAKAAAVMAGPVAASLEAPDVYGRAELFIGNKRVSTRELAKRNNSFTPQWGSTAEWVRVDLRYAHVRITLIDSDDDANDNVGVIDIDGATLIQAASEPGGRLAFRAAEQTHRQVLFLDLTVF
jgi:hypothetical protein